MSNVFAKFLKCNKHYLLSQITPDLEHRPFRFQKWWTRRKRPKYLETGPRWEFASVGANYQHRPVWVPIYWLTFETLLKSLRFFPKSGDAKWHVLKKCECHGNHISEGPGKRVLELKYFHSISMKSISAKIFPKKLTKVHWVRPKMETTLKNQLFNL